MNYLLPLFLSLTLLLQGQYTFTDSVYDTETGSSIKISSPFSGVPPRGYFPLEIEIENRSAEPVSWSFNVSSTDGRAYRPNSANKMSSSYQVGCPPKEVVRQQILVPVVTVLDYSRYQNNAMVTVSARNNRGEDYQPKLETALSTGMPALLMSERLQRPNGSSFTSEFNSGKTGHSSKNMAFDSHFLPENMPPDWRAYSGYDVIMFTLADWGEMNPTVQRALLEWGKMGGELLIFDTGAANLEAAGLPKEGNHGWGKVSVNKMEEKMKIPPKPFLAHLKKSHKANQDIISNYQGKWELKKAFGTTATNISLLVIILIIFAILVGPVNLFILAKEGQRHRLFFTTPIISIATTLLLFLVIFLKDGVGGAGVTQSLIEVDQKNNVLIGAQEQLSRTGMLLKSDFTLDTPAVIDPLVLGKDNFWARVKSGRNSGKCKYIAQIASPTKTTFKGDWYLSRTETAHLIHYKKPFRQGVEVRRQGGDYSLISSLDGDIQELYYKDAGGKPWKAQNLKQGVAVTLTPVEPNEFKQWITMNKKSYGTKNVSRLNRISRENNRYFALCEDWAHLETHPNIGWSKKKALVSGSIGEP